LLTIRASFLRANPLAINVVNLTASTIVRGEGERLRSGLEPKFGFPLFLPAP